MKARLLVVVVLVSLLVVLYASVVSANGGVPYYVCRSGWSQGFLCTYKNLHGDTNYAWNGYTIQASFGATPLSGTWVLEYR